MTQLYQVTCDPACGFVVKSHDKAETKRMAKEHMQMIHSKVVSDGDTEKMVMEI